MLYFINIFNTIIKSRYKMLPYAGYVDPESTLALGVHHDGHLEADSWAMFSVLIRLRKGVLQN